MRGCKIGSISPHGDVSLARVVARPEDRHAGAFPRPVRRAFPRAIVQSLGFPIIGNSRSIALSCRMMDGRKV
jgi:hypothetical protein